MPFSSNFLKIILNHSLLSYTWILTICGSAAEAYNLSLTAYEIHVYVRLPGSLGEQAGQRGDRGFKIPVVLYVRITIIGAHNWSSTVGCHKVCPAHPGVGIVESMKLLVWLFVLCNPLACCMAEI